MFVNDKRTIKSYTNTFIKFVSLFYEEKENNHDELSNKYAENLSSMFHQVLINKEFTKKVFTILNLQIKVKPKKKIF